MSNENRSVYIICGNEILWGPYSNPEAERDARALVEERLGQEIVFEYPPKGRVFENGSWRPKTEAEKVLDDEISQDDRIKELKFKIKAHAQSITENGYTFQGRVFQAREEDTIRMANVIILVNIVGAQWCGVWRDKNDDWLFLSFEDFLLLAKGAGLFQSSCFFKARNLIDELSSLSKLELANYSLETKWSEAEAQIPS
ncbi:DUF4376 domain-containing protein [Leptospira stimsonii]|uniref:DUF4376 domain-containing protein n=1 Tax=Leptospira stimsonii TaxID=2202203 RepID=UPI0010833D26|nr:DUF4376 domain-containing protein [Leptospira stimsonii]TGK12805.1 DUF4376 domain-containing protein [Leptospira stimsonii]